MLSIVERAQSVALTARQYAYVVDRDGRFPIEAITELKRLKLLSVAVDFREHKLTTLRPILDACTVLASVCPSTAMIFAMHTLCVMQISVHGNEWHQDFLSELDESQWLVASVTSETSVGGATAESECAIEMVHGRFVIRKQASVVSYGAQADAILVTARKDSDAAKNQQALTLCKKNDYSLTITTPWDSMGLRGTCSHGFNIEMSGADTQIFTESFGAILSTTGLPTTHLLWGHIWLGIAADAFAKAKNYRRRKRASDEKPGVADGSLFECLSQLMTMQSLLSTAAQQYLQPVREAQARSDRKVLLEINSIKVASSESAIRIVQSAMDICGLNGFVNKGEFTVSQNLRDVLSSRYMINNSRIAKNMNPLCMITDFSALNEN